MYSEQYKQFNALDYPHIKEHVVLMDALLTAKKGNVNQCEKINPVTTNNNPLICSRYADYLRVKGECYLALGDLEQCISLMVESASWYSKSAILLKKKNALTR
ncbi:hypothetical protein [Paenibacillus dendritiformis]|uniref:hypothetical protein n=1 Tax=Paenibacillus dendritiformis TaxID=130049 RepID=UPI0015604C91|nr:hypothetical protein [Paenibacillus dendritiformis]NRG01584.1 hypothetical protein [Paenibacillus dendritiformis]